jgi:hypothetical protein
MVKWEFDEVDISKVMEANKADKAKKTYNHYSSNKADESLYIGDNSVNPFLSSIDNAEIMAPETFFGEEKYQYDVDNCFSSSEPDDKTGKKSIDLLISESVTAKNSIPAHRFSLVGNLGRLMSHYLKKQPYAAKEESNQE